jgi:anti-anti-sigma regulatory factor
MNFARRCRPIGTEMNAYVCDLSGARPTAATVDSLARLALLLRREGSRLVLRHASPELVELIELMGLTDVLGVEPRR